MAWQSEWVRTIGLTWWWRWPLSGLWEPGTHRGTSMFAKGPDPGVFTHIWPSSGLPSVITALKRHDHSRVMWSVLCCKLRQPQVIQFLCKCHICVTFTPKTLCWSDFWCSNGFICFIFSFSNNHTNKQRRLGKKCSYINYCSIRAVCIVVWLCFIVLED